MHWSRFLLSRSALIAIGVVLGLVVLEIGLQVAAAWTKLHEQPLPESWSTANRRVLCLGDSNTYGIYVADRSQAYPRQLESFWNSAPRGSRIEALNLGYPGTNSSRLRRDLPAMLEALRPDLVVVMVGANDCWTVPVPVEGPQAFLASVLHFIQKHSRVYRFAYMLGRVPSAGVRPNGLEIRDEHSDERGGSGTILFGNAEFRMGWERGRYRGRFGKDLDRNLAAVAELTKRAGARLVLLTYPSEEENYGDANRYIRAAAERTDTPLIDTAIIFKALCPREPCPAYFYRDHHPTAHGYSIMARAVMRRLREIDRERPPGAGRMDRRMSAAQALRGTRVLVPSFPLLLNLPENQPNACRLRGARRPREPLTLASRQP